MHAKPSDAEPQASWSVTQTRAHTRQGSTNRSDNQTSMDRAKDFVAERDVLIAFWLDVHLTWNLPEPDDNTRVRMPVSNYGYQLHYI